MNSRKILPSILLFITPIILLTIAYLILSKWYTDDAFISFRYAKNFISGEGLVFNAGEYVQGYTNFLWILLLSFLKLAGIDFLTSSILINIMSVITLAFFIFSYLKNKLFIKNHTLNLLITALIISSPNLLSWTIGGGLEGPFFTLSVFVSFYFITRVVNSQKLITAGILFALSTLIRPEGALFFILGLLYLILFTEEFKLNNILQIISAYFAIIIPYFIWCLFYYGNILPNTFHAKVSFGYDQVYEGLIYCYRFFKSSPFLLLFLLVSILSFRKILPQTKFFLLVSLSYIFSLLSGYKLNKDNWLRL